MKVTIITACYNRRDKIGEAVTSVLGQDYPDIEYIVMDGASTDGSADYVRGLLEREACEGQTELVRRHARAAQVVSEPDGGMYEALNKGIRRATGDVIGFVHSDDMLISPQIISHYVRCFERTGADLVYADGQFVDECDPSRILRLWISGRYRRWKVRLGWLPLHPTVYMRRASFDPEVLYDEHYRVAADTKFLIYYLHESVLRVCYMPELVIRMRMGGLSTSPRLQRKMFAEDVSIFRYYGFSHPRMAKVVKMMWKVPQFINACLRRIGIPFSI